MKSQTQQEALRATMTDDELATMDGKPLPETEAAAEPVGEGGGETAETEAEVAETEAAEVAAAPDDEGTKAQPAPDPVIYEVAATDFAAQRAALKAERREVETKWTGGELTDDERIQALEVLQDKSDELLIEQTRATTLADANAQSARQQAERTAKAEDAAMSALAQAEAKALAENKPAIDYRTDTKAQTQFDMLFGAIKADPANAGLSPVQIVAEAHKAVRALRGMVDAATPTQPKPAIVIPRTLGALPAAAAQQLGGVDIATQLAGMDDPDQAEALWAKLPSSQRSAMLRATLPQPRRR